tara:strand:+ start:360 stop:731 length:372 start_codon:yes stop_codon:yes gene_type:complete
MTDKRTTEKAAHAEKARRSKAAALAAATKRADEIRQRLGNARGEMPGTLMGGEVGWKYSAIPADAADRTRDSCRHAFEAKGYSKVDDGHCHYVGMPKAEIWRIPEEIFHELSAAAAADRSHRE